MAKNMVELTEDNFKTEIQNGVTLVDFWAPWCGPCRLQTPILESVAGKLQGKAKVAKVNVDEERGPAMDLSIQAIPTIIIFKDGEEVLRFVGLQKEPDLISAIERIMKSNGAPQANS